jgi:hypothetical protein
MSSLAIAPDFPRGVTPDRLRMLADAGLAAFATSNGDLVHLTTTGRCILRGNGTERCTRISSTGDGRRSGCWGRLRRGDVLDGDSVDAFDRVGQSRVTRTPPWLWDSPDRAGGRS